MEQAFDDEDEDDDEDDNASFRTAEEGVWVFLTGSDPCSADQQVFTLLQDLELDAQRFPYVMEWRDLVSNSFCEEERRAWGREGEKRSISSNAAAAAKNLFNNKTTRTGAAGDRGDFIRVPKLTLLEAE